MNSKNMDQPGKVSPERGPLNKKTEYFPVRLRAWEASNVQRAIGLLSSTHGQRYRQQSGEITLQSVLIKKPKFLKATHNTEIEKVEILKSIVVEIGNKAGKSRSDQF